MHSADPAAAPHDRFTREVCVERSTQTRVLLRKEHIGVTYMTKKIVTYNTGGRDPLPSQRLAQAASEGWTPGVGGLASQVTKGERRVAHGAVGAHTVSQVRWFGAWAGLARRSDTRLNFTHRTAASVARSLRQEVLCSLVQTMHLTVPTRLSQRCGDTHAV